jgi:hypothetical protein
MPALYCTVIGLPPDAMCLPMQPPSTGVFDVKAVRRALETRVKALEAEKQQVGRVGS